MKQLAVDEFLDRLQDMPDYEAEQELVMRMETVALELAVLTNARAELEAGPKKSQEWRRLGQEMQILMQDSARLSHALKACRKRQDAIAWPKAVTALFGDEGYTQCRIWMASAGMQNPSAYDRNQSAPARR